MRFAAWQRNGLGGHPYILLRRVYVVTLSWRSFLPESTSFAIGAKCDRTLPFANPLYILSQHLQPPRAFPPGACPGCLSLNFQKKSANGVDLGGWEEKKGQEMQRVLHMPIGLIGQLITAG